MKKPILFFLSVFIFLNINFFEARAQLNNDQYEIQLLKNASVSVKHKQSGKVFILSPEFTIMNRADDPMIKFTGFAGSEKFAPHANNFIRLPYWQKHGSKEPVADFFEAAKPVQIKAKTGKAGANSIEWSFPNNKQFSITAALSLPDGINEPVISFTFVPKTDGYYSIGYTGMPEVSGKEIDAIWQPFVWQEKRFPEKSFLSTEDLSSLPGTMVEKDGMTYGLFADPSVIPFRLPNKTNSKFGVLIRNQKGNAQPMVFAPVLGNKDSELHTGEPYSFKFRVFAFEGNQPNAFLYAAKNIFGFKDYRENVYGNLNQTIENMIDFEMDDVYARWSADMKGFDYSTDVKQTVKNVSGLHPLSAAIITDNKGIYTRRALPMIEYLMSREKYLFSIDKNETHQQPSSKMTGPAIEVSELAALDIFYKGQSPVFKYFADSLSHTTRKLNLTKDSKGDSWPSLLALYKMTGNADYLKEAKQKADEYIDQCITHKQADFSDASTEQSAMFWTDYSPLWIELLNLYEETHDKKYLDGAAEGAKLYMQYVWFYPVIPDSSLLINKNGIVQYRGGAAVRDGIPAMPASPQEVPAWRLSQIGLTPEASNTLAGNPAIFLTSYAPHLLRLAYYTKNDFFRSVARSAVIGRYSNYPGYTITGEFNNVYARPDYPLRYQHEVSYNQFYYNHVWPQIAMLFDYLISDAYVSSEGKINFPDEFAEGYAYLKSNVYGIGTGSFYDDKNVHLWLPRQILKANNEQVNYLTGYGNNKFYIALLNQSNDEIDVEVEINPELVPVNPSGVHTSRLWIDNQSSTTSKVVNGKIKVHLSAKGIAAVAIDDVPVTTQFQQTILPKAGNKPDENSYKIIASPFGKISSAIISFGELSNAYIWLEASDENVKKATLEYRLGTNNWIKVQDDKYPFEFSIPLKEEDKMIEWKVEAESSGGQTNSSANITLQR